MWQFKRVLERQEVPSVEDYYYDYLYSYNYNKKRAIAAINRAAIACTLVVAAYLLETATPQLLDLTMGISASKIIACLFFVTWCKSAVEAVSAFLEPLGGESQPNLQQNDSRSRVRFFQPSLSAILVIMIAAVAVGVHMFFVFLHSDLCPHNPQPRPEQCDRYSGVLSNLDPHSRGMYFILKQNNYSAGDHQTAHSMKAVTAWHAQTLKKYNLFQEVDIPLVEEAEIFAFDNVVNAFTGWLRWKPVMVFLRLLSELVSPSFFPADDIFVPWPSPQEGVEILKFAGGEALDNIALSNAAAINVTSDEAIEYLATAGLAAHHLRACNERCERSAAFLVDYTLFSRAPVRIGYEGYGAIAYFNSAMKLTHIHCSHCGGANTSLIVAPGDELWQHAKWVFRVSMLITCTIKDHLVGTHLMCVPLQQRLVSL
jgi:hypothetical protein